MDENPRDDGYRLQAPGAEPATTSYRLPGHEDAHRPLARQPLHVDEHMRDLDFRTEEKVGGVVYKTMGSGLPHAAQNGEIDYVLRGLLKPTYCVASDLKTRFEAESDFASDSAAVKKGIDSETGRRHLERLAFEVVWKQTRAAVTAKAPRMIRRGVKRVFAVFVRTEEVAEWSPKKAQWVTLPPEAVIRDTCLVKPLPVAALLDAGKANTAVVQGLEAQGAPEIERIRTEGRVEGRVEGKVEATRAAVLTAFAARGFEVTDEIRQTVSSCDDLATLERWHRQVITATDAEDALT